MSGWGTSVIVDDYAVAPSNAAVVKMRSDGAFVALCHLREA